MTLEDKELLLKDLCARLPYRVKVKGYSGKTDTLTLGDCDLVSMFYKDEDNWYCKPYLRPMSTMTEGEKVEYCDLQDKFLLSSQCPVTDGYALFDWLNKKMFDYHGLIPKDLAISTEVFNPYKDFKL